MPLLSEVHMKLSAAVPLLFVILVSSPFLAGEAGIPDLSGKILTVLGPIDPSELGPTLGHEHILIDYTRGNKEGRLKTATQAAVYLEPLTLKNLSDVRAGLVLNRDNLLLTDVDLAIREVLEFKRWGGDGIIDTTSIGLGRDPEGLSQIARGSGLDIIMGAGYYVESYHPPEMEKWTVEEVTQSIIKDITVGVDGRDIRSGIIGEVGVGRSLSEAQIKSIRASARASRVTGAPISFHYGGRGEGKFTTLDTVESEGARLNRVIIGHANHIATQVPYMKRLLERGVYLQFDLFGEVIPRLGRIHDRDVVDGILQLCEAGYADRILVAQDVCTKSQLKAYGGVGFSYIMEFVAPELRRRGLTQAQTRLIQVENPRRILTFDKPRP